MARINDPYELIIGTGQLDRLPAPLDQESDLWPKIDDRTTEELKKFAHEFSKIVKYYNNFNQQDGNWEVFFNVLQDPSNPHYTLFLAFLESYKLAQEEINSITGKHLNCFYKEILHFVEQPATPDKVHILFQLAKNQQIHRLKKGTLLNAGKDKNGNQLVYKTDDEIVVNRAEIASVKSLYLDKFNRFHVKQESRRESRKDADGKTIYDSWSLFGESQEDEPLWTNPDLDYELGFAIANQNFECAEGERIITLFLSTTDVRHERNKTISRDDSIDIDDDSLLVFFSGTDNWIGPFSIESDQTYKDGSNKVAILEIKVPADAPSISGYTTALSGPQFSTSLPVMKVLVNPRAYKFAYPHFFDFKIKYIQVSVHVGFYWSRAKLSRNTGIRDVVIKNDQGIVNPKNPFQPFGTEPIIGSELTISCPEVFKKDLAFVHVTWDWIGLPILEEHYNNYTSPPDTVEINPADFTAVVSTIGFNEGNEEALSAQLKIKLINPVFYVLNTRKASNGYFKVMLDGPPANRYQFTGFGHEEYSKIYTNRILYNSKFANNPSDTISIPDKPWVPKLKELTIRYVVMADLLSVNANKSDFFHITPFGFKEKNIMRPEGEFLLPEYSIAIHNRYEIEFHLNYHYVGLKNVTPPQKVSILYQLEEGSGNSEIPTFSQAIRWYYLNDNVWMPFGDSEIGPDTTKGLLSSGIISFTLPESATDNNTVMPPGLFWIRAVTSNESEGLSRAINLHTQAVSATYVENEQDTDIEHYDNPLEPYVIGKLIDKDVAIKKIVQPYVSFKGIAKEAGNQFFQRVNEHLRHRVRSSDRWDYEHIVLQHYPAIYKLKCLNYTNKATNKEAGTVSLVTVPDLKRNNVLNSFEPKLNSGFLSEVEQFISNKISLFVSFLVQNPLYEKIRVHAEIKYHKKYDPGLYTGILNKDLINFLAPWVKDASAEITFGGVLYRSQIIDIIEERPYVDKVKDLWIEQIIDHDYAELGIGFMVIRDVSDIEYDEEDTFVVGFEVKVAKATTARSVLTSVKKHDLKIWYGNF